MTTIPSQTRANLDLAIQKHAQPPASTLVCSQFVSAAATASFTVDPELDEMQADTSAGSVTATMLAGARCYPGKVFTFRKKHASNSFIVAFTGGELYEGVATITLTEDNAVAAIKWDPIASEWVRAGAVGVGGGAGAAAAIDFSNVTPATGRTALGVSATTAVDLKTDTHCAGPFSLSLVGADADAIRFRFGFAGTITGILGDVSKGTVATGTAIATLTVGGASPVANTLTFSIADAPGAKRAMTPTGPNCVFTADAEILIAQTGLNDGVGTKAGYTVQYTRS